MEQNIQKFTTPERTTDVLASERAPLVIADAATISIDARDRGQFDISFTASVGSSRTISNPSNMIDGRLYLFVLRQDSVGARIVNWDTKFNFAGGTAPTLTTAASKKDILLFRYDATTDKLDHLATQTNL